MAGLNSENDLKRPGRAAFVLAVILALGALGISVYLSYTSIITGRSPAGCGSGSGCAEVLGSKWSYLIHVPVSVYAALVYTHLLASLFMAKSPKHAGYELARVILSIYAAAILAAALWFIYLQLFVVKAVCPYCMADHALGIALAGVLIFYMRARRPIPMLVGAACVVLMAVIQINSTTAIARLDAPASGTDADTTTADGRTVSVLNGKLTLNLADEPVLGDPGAEHVMVMMYDYACPHCRHTHGVIHELLRDRPGLLAVVLLPTPMNHACNPHTPEEMDARFDESCELARVALSVFLADRAGFADFDRWMYEPEAPRSAEAARAEALRRVGEENFEHNYHDPRMQQMIARNVYVYGQSGADRVPVLVVPGRAAVVGRVDGVGLLIDLLETPDTAAPQE
ncbi:MAG: vitamin K epoxide reductase family protein [Phycisphaerales bacterium]